MLKMSQKDLAEAAGVGESTIKDFETGKRLPRPESLQRIQEALERRGIEFSNGDEPGVKLRPSKAIIPA
ncbi:MAG: helix-turn-helix transcriptional regulator [Polyangia bacterium]